VARFNIVVGISTKGPELAARDAEKKARKAGGEQIGISSCVLGSSGLSSGDSDLLNNVAKNIYQLVQCTCLETVGATITKPGTPPPIVGPSRGGEIWVVYILLKK
jgi:hypothetical protein